MRHDRARRSPCHRHTTNAAAPLLLLALLGAAPARAQAALGVGYQVQGYAVDGLSGFDGLLLGLDAGIARGIRWYLRFEAIGGRHRGDDARLRDLSTGLQVGYFGPRSEVALGVGVGGYALLQPSESDVGGMTDIGVTWRVWLSGHVGLFTDLRLRSLSGRMDGGSSVATAGVALRLGR